MLTIALAKGRTTDGVWPLLLAAGLPLPTDLDETRALVFDVAADAATFQVHRMRYLLAKPADVPTYVQYGVADLGIVGKDILMEEPRDVSELVDLECACCRLCVAGRPEDELRPPRRVATKYPRLTDQYFRSQGTAVEIVPLSGSIELAAVIGLTDRIFDLVQTGATLRANGLKVFDTVSDVSARLIANRSSYHLQREAIRQVAEALAAAVARRKTG
ncbi:ATP phosphoribosyltransferase [Alicyclobacillus shizuokensis]|uniref:ATP phosphoribosyltransferase n=1 Tax=Alicyclobacillus shizuokensis TaxID=392014 RepID=UPI00082F45D9|nr:ATP phosphoribosyltransferase [Alicyclobacillus shizuokensis]MCL6625306.1 ATP phosphoribosyltransferase [Alicyclobacillus shizuokensis]